MGDGARTAQHIVQGLQFLAALVQCVDRTAAHHADLPFVAFHHAEFHVHALFARGAQHHVGLHQGAFQQAVHADDLHQRMHVLVHQGEDAQVALAHTHAGTVGLVAGHFSQHGAVGGVQIVLHAAQGVVDLVGGHGHAERVAGLHAETDPFAGALQCGDVALDDLRAGGHRVVVQEVEQVQQGLAHHVVR